MAEEKTKGGMKKEMFSLSLPHSVFFSKRFRKENRTGERVRDAQHLSKDSRLPSHYVYDKRNYTLLVLLKFLRF